MEAKRFIEWKIVGTGNESGDAGRALPISQSAFGYLIEPTVRVVERLYVGPRYHFGRTTVTLAKARRAAEWAARIPQ
jgi:hypothetical protein